MKIGIVTFHTALNAGAILQAYALQTCLKSMGHQVEFIDMANRHKACWKDFVAKSPKVMLHKWTDNFNGWKYRKRKDWNKFLHKSPTRYLSYEELCSNPPEYDIYIVGSDQVWNFLYDLNPLYLLEFAPARKKRIAYAASMGQCDIPARLHPGLKKSLSQFHAISLREDNGVDFVNTLLGKKVAEKTLDPTLLIQQKDYDAICEPPAGQDAFIASYILNQLDKQQKIQLAQWTANAGLPLINLRNPDTCLHLPHAKNTIVTPYQWLGYIRKAESVICGSFHATVFSLIFHKPFIVLLPKALEKKGGNTRINSLLEPLGLQGRILYDCRANDIEAAIRQAIDWDRVEAALTAQKQQSISFLKKALG